MTHDVTTVASAVFRSSCVKIGDLMGTFQYLIEQLLDCLELVKARPVFRDQEEYFDKCLAYCTHLLYLLIRAPNKTKEESFRLREMTEKLVGYNLKKFRNGDSLLHMAVNEDNRIAGFSESLVFPSAEVVHFLIESGANVNAMNDKHATALHVAVSIGNLNSTIVDILLENGAHLDTLDNKNRSPLEIFHRKKQLTSLNLNLLRPLEHVSLKCLAARVLGRCGVIYENLPKKLCDFIELHRQTRRSTSASEEVSFEINGIDDDYEFNVDDFFLTRSINPIQFQSIKPVIVLL